METVDYSDPEFKAAMFSWVAGWISANHGRFTTEPFLNDALSLMPPQMLDEALDQFNLRIDWADSGQPFFRVAPPWEK
jgi:hypothetical protein